MALEQLSHRGVSDPAAGVPLPPGALTVPDTPRGSARSRRSCAPQSRRPGVFSLRPSVSGRQPGFHPGNASSILAGRTNFLDAPMGRAVRRRTSERVTGAPVRDETHGGFSTHP